MTCRILTDFAQNLPTAPILYYTTSSESTKIQYSHWFPMAEELGHLHHGRQRWRHGGVPGLRGHRGDANGKLKASHAQTGSRP